MMAGPKPITFATTFAISEHPSNVDQCWYASHVTRTPPARTSADSGRAPRSKLNTVAPSIGERPATSSSSVFSSGRLWRMRGGAHSFVPYRCT